MIEPAVIVSQHAPVLRVLSAKVAWGTHTTDGTLGYDGGCCPGVLCHGDLRGCTVLSAHAPSRLEIESGEPLEVCGFLNMSGRFNPANPVEFWADWNFVGEVTVPGTVTAWKRLRPGRHVLVAACAEASSRHTLWAVRRAEPVAASRLAVFTIAAYPEERVPAEVRILARSARRHDLDLEVCFVGEGYASHFDMKVRRLRPLIERVAAPRVVYVDGRDCLLLSGLDRIERQFESMGASLIMSAEASCWPIRDWEWGERFADCTGGCRWPNAGQWMGERQAVLAALGALEDLHARASGPERPDDSPSMNVCRRLPWDDQLLWQVAAVDGLVDLTLDFEGRVFRNVNTLDTTLIGNRDFDVNAGGVRFRASGQRPCVLHFSGHAAQQCMHQWGALLGAY